MAFGEGDGSSPPPSLICPTLQPHMQREDSGEPTARFLEALGGMFSKLSANGETLTMEEQEHWLTLVNKNVRAGGHRTHPWTWEGARAAAKRRRNVGGRDRSLAPNVFCIRRNLSFFAPICSRADL